jgi:signal transduction histidine kinase
MAALAGVVAAVATVAVALDPSVRFAIEAGEVRLALETTQALVALTVAYLIYGSFRRRRLANDLALVYALGLLGSSSLFFAFIPQAGDGSNTLVFHTWAPLFLRLIAISVIATAALAPDRRVRAEDRLGAWVILACDVTLAVVALAVAALVTVLPKGVRMVGETVGVPELEGHPAFIGLQLVLAVLSAAAAVGFLRRANRRPEPLTTAMGVGAVLYAFAWLCFAVYPSVDTDIVQSGDALRLGFYLVLLVGAEREINRYWAQLASVAVYDERRRLARDLHDGLAQELAYVVTQTRMLTRGNAAPGTDERVAAAAERALDESRRAITALTSTGEEPLHLAIARAAEDIASRVGVAVEVDADPRVAVAPAVREALLRIVRESVNNAGRHGHADHVRVVLSSGGVLQVTDDGSGFDVAGAGQGRYGLISMRERAERLGGRFRIESAPGRGTTVEVALP